MSQKPKIQGISEDSQVDPDKRPQEIMAGDKGGHGDISTPASGSTGENVTKMARKAMTLGDLDPRYFFGGRPRIPGTGRPPQNKVSKLEIITMYKFNMPYLYDN